MSNIKNKNIGSTLESFLKEEGDYKEAQSTAIKRIKNMHKEMQENPERAALYLEEVLSGGDIEVFKLALKNVIDARLGGMTALSKLTGITKRTLVRTLSPEGILRFKTLTKILQAVGLRISVTPKERQFQMRTQSKLWKNSPTAGENTLKHPKNYTKNLEFNGR